MSGYGYLIASCEQKFYKKIRVRDFSIIKGVEKKCVFCGRQEPEIKLTIDHKLPKSKNPKARGLLANYQLLCWPCNMLKGNKKIKP